MLPSISKWRRCPREQAGVEEEAVWELSDILATAASDPAHPEV